MFCLQQIKIAVGEEVVLRGQRNQRSINNHHRIAKRESPIDNDDEGKGTDIEDDINDANEEEEERYSLS